MNIPGFDKLREHLPDFSEKQAKLLIMRLPGFAILLPLLGIAFECLFRMLFTWTSSIIWLEFEAWFPLIWLTFLIFGGSRFAQQGFIQKKRLLEKDKKTAYEKVATQVFSGIGMVFGGLVYNFYLHPHALGSKSIQFAQNYIYTTNLLGRIVFRDILLVLGIIFAFLTLLTAGRAVKKFGIDNAALVYVFYPEESKVVDEQIYSIVRHPMYLAVMMGGIGGFLTTLSVYSTFGLLVLIVSFYIHILWYEEKELIERFGDSYKSYRKEVPALFVRPKNWLIFLKILLKG